MYLVVHDDCFESTFPEYGAIFLVLFCWVFVDSSLLFVCPGHWQ